jgi:hypothetical protein
MQWANQKQDIFVPMALMVGASQLVEGLLAIAQNTEVADYERSLYGTKYMIDGVLDTPNGVMIRVRTIWIIEKGQDTPRFIAAYPIEKE